MRWRALVPLLTAPLAYALIRAAAVARVRRFENLDADTADLPGLRLYLRGRRVHLTIDGQGPPLLILHGFGSSGAAFRRLSSHLRPTMTVIAPDMPGWGYSERSPQADHSPQANAALMLELLDRLGIASVVVFGHGAGAAIGLLMAQAAPARVIALVLSDARWFDPALPRWFRPLLVPIVPLLVETRPGQRLIQRAMRVPGQWSDEHLVTAYLDEARTFGHTATVLALVTHGRHGPKPDGSSVQVPTMLFSSEDSEERLSAEIVDFLRQRLGAPTAPAAGGPRHHQDQLGAHTP